MGRRRIDGFGSATLQRFGGLYQGTSRINHIVHDQGRSTGHVANDMQHFDLADAVIVTPLVDNRQSRVPPLSICPCSLDPARIGSYNRQVREIEGIEIPDQNWRGEQVIGRDVKKTLDLPGMQIEQQNPVSACLSSQVRYQLG